MSPEQLLGELEGENRVVICDLEAGLGTLSRMQPGQVDAVLVVANPTPKAIEVARRAAEAASARGAAVVVAANRVRSADDLELIRAGLPGHELAEVPEDEAVADAERDGRAPIDLDGGGAPAVHAAAALARRLLELQPGVGSDSRARSTNSP